MSDSIADPPGVDNVAAHIRMPGWLLAYELCDSVTTDVGYKDEVQNGRQYLRAEITRDQQA